MNEPTFLLSNNGIELDPDKPVLVMGAAGVDIIGRVKEEIRDNSSYPAQIRSTYGGVARNVAENLARLGQKVILLTAVGDDQTGQALVQDAACYGINTDYILHLADIQTSTYLAVYDSNGVTHLALDDMRTIKAMTPAYIRAHANLFKKASLLFIDGNLPAQTLRTVISLARRARLPICADPATASLAHRLHPYLADLFLITPNHVEAGLLAEKTFDPSSRRQATGVAKKLVSQGVKIAIVTLAEHGVTYATSHTSGYVPAIRTDIIDPTGAGDALSAAVIFALLNQIPLDDAMRLGISAASLTLSYRGAVVPDLTLEKLYDHLVI